MIAAHYLTFSQIYTFPYFHLFFLIIRPAAYSPPHTPAKRSFSVIMLSQITHLALLITSISRKFWGFVQMEKSVILIILFL